MNLVDLKSGDRVIIHRLSVGNQNMATFLTIANNLSDLSNPATALVNLGLGFMNLFPSPGDPPSAHIFFLGYDGNPFLTWQPSGVAIFDSAGNGVMAASTTQRIFQDCSGNTACDFQNRSLNDSSTQPSLDFDMRKCFKNDGVSVTFTWADGPQMVTASDVTTMATELAAFPSTLSFINAILNCLNQYGMLNQV